MSFTEYLDSNLKDVIVLVQELFRMEEWLSFIDLIQFTSVLNSYAMSFLDVSRHLLRKNKINKQGFLTGSRNKAFNLCV